MTILKLAFFQNRMGIGETAILLSFIKALGLKNLLCMLSYCHVSCKKVSKADYSDYLNAD